MQLYCHHVSTTRKRNVWSSVYQIFTNKKEKICTNTTTKLRCMHEPVAQKSNERFSRRVRDLSCRSFLPASVTSYIFTPADNNDYLKRKAHTHTQTHKLQQVVYALAVEWAGHRHGSAHSAYTHTLTQLHAEKPNRPMWSEPVICGYTCMIFNLDSSRRHNIRQSNIRLVMQADASLCFLCGWKFLVQSCCQHSSTMCSATAIYYVKKRERFRTNSKRAGCSLARTPKFYRDVVAKLMAKMIPSLVHTDKCKQQVERMAKWFCLALSPV